MKLKLKGKLNISNQTFVFHIIKLSYRNLLKINAKTGEIV